MNEQELKNNTKLLEEYKRVVDAGAIVSKTDLNGKITYVVKYPVTQARSCLEAVTI